MFQRKKTIRKENKIKKLLIKEATNPVEENKEEEKEEENVQKDNKKENDAEPNPEDTNPTPATEKEPKQEEEENQNQVNEEEQEYEDQNKNVTLIYDNVDYFLSFLNAPEETKSNYVLVGYFYRKSMGEIINKLLLFQEEGLDDFIPQKLELLQKVLEELKETNDEDKYECICSTLITTFYNKTFFLEFMKKEQFLGTLYSILEASQSDNKKLIAVLRLILNVQENILKNFGDNRCTVSCAQENPMDFLNMFSGMYGLEDQTQKEENHELDQIVLKDIVTLMGLIEKNKFNFMNDFEDFSSKENAEFIPTYEKPQKKLGMKKLAQIELFRSILDILLNAYAIYDDQGIRDMVINIIKQAQEKKLFWKMHQIFFDFPFCNLYQTYYSQIMDIILNENSPEELIKNTLFENEGENGRNLIQIFIDKMLKNMEFEFNSGRKAFHPNYSIEISILTKIIENTNEYVKQFVKDNKNLLTFHQILGNDINYVFNQNLFNIIAIKISWKYLKKIMKYILPI